MKTCVLQFGCYAYTKLIDTSYLHHFRKCLDHGYELIVETEPLLPNKRPSWEKVRMIRDALHNGFDKIIWLDADALWLNGELHNVNDTHPFGMTWHRNPSYGDHFNCGVMYINNTPTTVEFVERWHEEPDIPNHPWQDQLAFIKLRNQYPDLIKKLGHTWNSVVGFEGHNVPDPNVIAWHGVPYQAFDEMKNYVVQ